jgi:hypothetical protein
MVMEASVGNAARMAALPGHKDTAAGKLPYMINLLARCHHLERRGIIS